ncbi:PREDICTED: platelet endothelial cell adhesion molecule isoform X2 [Condylura cristata]|uniref:platelet endothelial cell adhesion molecule isoform X2 n=1 Tax=Condylura cristata TaxID=143302 RepID=UPI0006435AE1|nr:PREDICTED: platelet endothelial cell adhesion molecule isoform X2 [Condylura cristata]
MWLGLLLTLLLCPSLEGQENSFTINSIHMEILPKNEVQNGENLTLQCIVDVSTTSLFKPQYQMLFYKNDALFYNISTVKSTESFPIPQARVYNSGTYKCTVILNNKEKTSAEYQVFVRGVPNPRVTLDKKEAIEGGVVKVNCSVPEERPPIHFIIEKFKLEVKDVKQKREKTSLTQNSVMMEFPVEEQDHIISFHCQVIIVSGTQVESSQSVKSDMVTVTESFTTPKFHIRPQGLITEGDELQIRCTIQVTHLPQVFPEIIIQKDKVIVAHSKEGNQAVYSVMAMVEHSGHYKCKVETSRISKVSSIVVNITELFSKPKLEFTSTRLDQGEILSLWCSVPGQPPANFSIQKGDMIVSQTQNFTKIASVWDSGTYTCLAGVGKVVKKSNSVNITVCEMLSRPRIFHNARSEVIKGQTIEVSCQSTNGSSPISYSLLKASNVLDRRDENSNSPAVFQDKPTQDTEYQCLADNCHSHDRIASSVLQVKVIAPVDEVKLSFLLDNVVESGKTIALQCAVNEASGPITYKFYRDKEDRPFFETSLNDTQAIWHRTEASKEHEGQYYCTALNRANPPKSNTPQSNILTVKVFFAPWKKALIAVFVTGVIIAALILGARCYVLKKGRAKQMPVEMSRPAAPLLSSNSEKMSDATIEASRHYGYNEDVANHAKKPINENKEPLTLDVEYTEVEVTSPEPHRGLETKGTETVYSEIRKADPDFMENRYSRTEGSLDGT